MEKEVGKEVGKEMKGVKNNNQEKEHVTSLHDIHHTIFINLDRRPDRLQLVTAELAKLPLGSPPQRFAGLEDDKGGAIGCTRSHIAILQKAIDEAWDHVLVLEDDIQFLQPELFIRNCNLVLKQHGTTLDVLLLAGNNVCPYREVDEQCVRVLACQTTTGYFVAKPYLPTLLANFQQGLQLLLRNPTAKPQFAIDRYWFRLQIKDRWLLVIPLTVVQRPDYSDIECMPVNYQAMMLSLSKKQR